MSHPTTQVTTTQLADVVTRVLVDTLSIPAEEVVPDADLRDDLGLDSLDLLELLSAIQSYVGTDVDDAEVSAIRTVGDALALIARLRGGETP